MAHPLTLPLLAVGLEMATALAALVCWRSNRLALALGGIGCVAASILGIIGSLLVLLAGGTATLHQPWSLPLGALALGIDPLTAFFLLCVHLVSGLAALYGIGYLRGHAGHRPLAPIVCLFNLLVAALSAIPLARDGVLFLMVWEVMSIAGFFLVTFDDARAEVRRAGMVYLIASHVGVVFLFILFALLARHAGSYSFAAFAASAAASPISADLATACFVLALAGFGTKAGFWLLHTWLPEAHPAAPSHVSATMSGVMIKMGIYGLLRVLTFLGPPPPWWGMGLVAIGALSGVLGVLHALAQHDLKRLLAYCSVENVGIIALGIGMGLLGQSAGQPELAFLGYGAALLHTLNHGLFKGLLFQGAGSVVYATGSQQLDAQGGLLRRMPTTGFTFLVAAIAICGLPPLNGFVSEYLIYVAAFRGGTALHGFAAVTALAVLPTLALMGGLAAATFIKAFGVVFLGEPRSDRARQATESPRAMRFPMVAGALFCLLIGLFPAAALTLVERPVASLMSGAEPTAAALAPLPFISLVGGLLLALCALLVIARRALLRRREVTLAPTWGCGYEAPSARMQYTASSFAEPLLEPFSALLQREPSGGLPVGYFPCEAHYEVQPRDAAGERVILPVTRRLLRALHGFHVIQQGRVQLYLVYIMVTVVALLVWQFFGAGR